MFVFSGGVKVTISHTVWKKHFPFVYVVIFSKVILENKQVVIHLLMRASQIGSVQKSSKFMKEELIVLTAKLVECVMIY